MMIDAGVVIAEILLDLHAMRSQYREATADLKLAMQFLNDTYAKELEGLPREFEDDMRFIVEILRKKASRPNVARRNTNSFGTTAQTREEDEVEWDEGMTVHRTSDAFMDCINAGYVQLNDATMISMVSTEGAYITTRSDDQPSPIGSATVIHPEIMISPDGFYPRTLHFVQNSQTHTALDDQYSQITTWPDDYDNGIPAPPDGNHLRIVTSSDSNDPRIITSPADHDPKNLISQDDSISRILFFPDYRNHQIQTSPDDPYPRIMTSLEVQYPRVTTSPDDYDSRILTSPDDQLSRIATVSTEYHLSNNRTTDEINLDIIVDSSEAFETQNNGILVYPADDKREIMYSTVESQTGFQIDLESGPTMHAFETVQKIFNETASIMSWLDYFQLIDSHNGTSASDGSPVQSNEFYRRHSYADKLLKIAHIFHFSSIAILGIFVIQVSLKCGGMGCEFFKKRIEIFDAIIVLTSFGLDLVFVEGVTGTQGEEAIALLIILLLWRILRVINGIMVTTKKRQEFRIQLQKRARRRAEKKIEYLEDDKNWKDREIANLKRLCQEKGAVEEEITACKPRRRTIFQKMDTSMGLSSIASLSLGLSMSMTGAGSGGMRGLAMRSSPLCVVPPRILTHATNRNFPIISNRNPVSQIESSSCKNNNVSPKESINTPPNPPPNKLCLADIHDCDIERDSSVERMGDLATNISLCSSPSGDYISSHYKSNPSTNQTVSSAVSLEVLPSCRYLRETTARFSTGKPVSISSFQIRGVKDSKKNMSSTSVEAILQNETSLNDDSTSVPVDEYVNFNQNILNNDWFEDDRYISGIHGYNCNSRYVRGSVIPEFHNHITNLNKSEDSTSTHSIVYEASIAPNFQHQLTRISSIEYPVSVCHQVVSENDTRNVISDSNATGCQTRRDHTTAYVVTSLRNGSVGTHNTNKKQNHHVLKTEDPNKIDSTEIVSAPALLSNQSRVDGSREIGLLMETDTKRMNMTY